MERVGIWGPITVKSEQLASLYVNLKLTLFKGSLKFQSHRLELHQPLETQTRAVEQLFGIIFQMFCILHLPAVDGDAFN